MGSNSTASLLTIPASNSFSLSKKSILRPLFSHFHLPSATFTFPSVLHKRCNLFPLYAQSKKPNTSLKEMSDLDLNLEFDDELEAFDDDFIDDNEDEEEGVILPLEKMQNWLENKPRGFGEGKVYDTSLEDKLLVEIEQSVKAQAANIDNLKNNPISANSKKQKQNNKVNGGDVVASEFRVRVANLPKKKNVDRDLRSAFKEAGGIVNIVPAVSGNKKTREPVCRGFAFVDFKSEEYALRFVRQFSGQSLAFGRVQKRIKCTMAISQASNSSDDESASDLNLIVPAFEDVDTDFDMDNSSKEESSSDILDNADELTTEELQAVADGLESFSISDFDDGDSPELVMKPTTGSSPSKKPGKSRMPKKKSSSKEPVSKVKKLEIPGSAKRLKIREKALLNDVFSKYRSKLGPASVEES